MRDFLISKIEMIHTKFKTVLIFSFAIFLGVEGFSQARSVPTSQQFRLGDRIIRISEPGQLADSVNVWGDVGSSGRYLIPKGTKLSELISYSFGPRTLRDGQTDLDWSKMRVEINIQEYNKENKKQSIEKFRIHFEEPFPVEMNQFELKNNQTITLRVKRKPSFRDYVGVIAPVLSSIATTFLIIDRL